MNAFSVAGYSLELFNVRTETGALRAIHLWSTAGSAAAGANPPRLTLWFLAGEPLPRVEEVEEGRWEASFPISHFDALVDMLRNEGPVLVELSEDARLVLRTASTDV